MSETGWIGGPPTRILLATDLSPRCDRALDRAMLLADQWRAKLVVLHVLEDLGRGISDTPAELPSWRRPPDPLIRAQRQLIADIGAVAEKASIVIEEGDPVDAIVRTAERLECDLVVTGVARNELFGRVSLGRTVDRLLRRSRVPILVVKNRARRPYGHIVVTTDFSESSRRALEAVAQIFPRHEFTLFHGYHAPMSGRMMDTAAYQRDYRKIVVQDCEAFLKGMEKLGNNWRPPRVLIEQGAPAALLRDYVREHDVDLLVLGTHGRSAVFEVFLGSVAKEILDDVPCDALVIREPRAATES